MKELLDLSQEYILDGRFEADEIKTDKGYEPDWIDDEKKKAHGKNVINNVTALIPVYDREGYGSSGFQKVWIPKDDIIKLAKRIEEIESAKLIGGIEDDLPF